MRHADHPAARQCVRPREKVREDGSLVLHQWINTLPPLIDLIRLRYRRLSFGLINTGESDHVMHARARVSRGGAIGPIRRWVGRGPWRR